VPCPRTQQANLPDYLHTNFFKCWTSSREESCEYHLKVFWSDSASEYIPIWFLLLRLIESSMTQNTSEPIIIFIISQLNDNFWSKTSYIFSVEKRRHQKSFSKMEFCAKKMFFRVKEKTLVHYKLHWKAMHPAFKY